MHTIVTHACGYTLANKGHDTRALQAHLGHRNIQHTVRYTEQSPMRFKDSPGANRNYENRIYWPCHGVNLRTKLGSVF